MLKEVFEDFAAPAIGAITVCAVFAVGFYLHDESRLKPPVDQCNWKTELSDNLPADAIGAQGNLPQSDKFYVTAVHDGGSLQVWSRKPYGHALYGPTEDIVRLAGVWSESSVEPAAIYEARLQLLNRLVGCEVMVSVRVHTYFINGAPNIQTEITSPAEVRIGENLSLNELLIRTGSAILNSKDELFDKERQRYGRAQNEAAAEHRGLWATEEIAAFYQRSTKKNEFQIHPAAKPAMLGFSTFLVVQAILALFGTILTYTAWNEPRTRAAALFLLSLPVIFATPYLMIWLAPALGLSAFGGEPYPLANRRNFPSGSDILWFPYYLLFMGLIIVWIRALAALISRGPLEEWKTIWKNARVPRTVFTFFVGLVVLIGLMTTLHRLFGQFDTFKDALFASVATLFGFQIPMPIATESASSSIVLVQKVFVIIWLLICSAVLPRPERRAALDETRVRVLAMSVSSIAAAVLVAASVFTGFFYASGYASDVGSCFWFALANLFRLTYGTTDASSVWTATGQSVEVIIGFFLSLVGFRAILSVLQSQAVSSVPTAP